MKKILIIMLMILTTSILVKEVQASDYQTFEEITFDHKGVKLLSDYGSKEMDKYYSKLKNKKFWGWKTFTAYKDEEMSYVDDILYIIINDGDSAIEETIKLSRDYAVKKQYSASGSIDLKGDGNVDGFKLGLEENLDFDITTTVSGSIEEVYTMKIEVDPGTKLKILTAGEGRITNGVAKYYRFWRNVKKGGFEIFVMTTEYYYIEKERL